MYIKTIIHDLTIFFKGKLNKMKKQMIFEGAGTALITPFKNGRIDFSALEDIIEKQIKAKIPALIIGGTTGEAATLSDVERYTLFEFAREKAAGRVKLIFGTGTNDTRAAVRHTRRAEEIGCDGVLVVTPYYNKGTYSGVVRHYEEIAKATSLPVILYNVPSRTGVNLTETQLKQLSKIENVVAIKEAGDSMDRYVSLSALTDSLALYAGNDSQIYTTLALGGDGVISVLSNVCPRLAVAICESFYRGEYEKSRELQIRALPLISALFAETNPAPVKYAMKRLGLCENALRLPLLPIGEETEKKIDAALESEFIKTYL